MLSQKMAQGNCIKARHHFADENLGMHKKIIDSCYLPGFSTLNHPRSQIWFDWTWFLRRSDWSFFLKMLSHCPLSCHSCSVHFLQFSLVLFAYHVPTALYQSLTTLYRPSSCNLQALLLQKYLPSNKGSTFHHIYHIWTSVHIRGVLLIIRLHHQHKHICICIVLALTAGHDLMFLEVQWESWWTYENSGDMDSRLSG